MKKCVIELQLSSKMVTYRLEGPPKEALSGLKTSERN